eukprot:jgi/Tetstr1/458764/TSEL_045148.t1
MKFGEVAESVVNNTFRIRSVSPAYLPRPGVEASYAMPRTSRDSRTSPAVPWSQRQRSLVSLGRTTLGTPSVLIHGVRLTAEKLGPRAGIVHTNLRHACNEAWRRTIIQRHIDCSPFHPVIHALVASLSTDGLLLVVDDRPAPMWSERGV